ncbi:hypothetical protein H2248_009193 [Termitomyces sp. 'cryptogamus']|nr:hypothetical protein H2248_009193 [Termitomyces sp. 'cryptogamus']
MSIHSDAEKQKNHLGGMTVDESDVDVAATLGTGSEAPLSPAEALRLRLSCSSTYLWDLLMH